MTDSEEMVDELQKHQNEKNLNLKPVKSNHTYKHSPRACLECRTRHSKCDGRLPICGYCTKKGRVCVYVESKRGGSRTKGVSKKRDLSSHIPELRSVRELSKRHLASKRDSNDFTLPCHLKTAECDDTNCAGLNSGGSLDLPCVKRNKDKIVALAFSGFKSTSNEDSVQIHQVKRRTPFVTPNAQKDLLDEFSSISPAIPLLTNVSHLMDVGSFNRSDILNNYYTTFHKVHPIAPGSDEIDSFLDASPSCYRETLLVMKVFGDGYKGPIFSDNADLVSDRILQCYQEVHATQDLDVVSLQNLTLIAAISHISGLHDFSSTVRNECVQLILALDIQNIDSPLPDVSNLERAIFRSPRLAALRLDSLLDIARRSYWEFYFFDVIIGSADGKTLSRLASIDSKINFPTNANLEDFDYKTRAEAGNLVSNAVRVNLNLIHQTPTVALMNRLTASIENMNMRFQDPASFKAPFLINGRGHINEGVHQGIVLLNYARIFAHRPFSFLWKSDIPQNPRCADTALEDTKFTPSAKMDARKLIETRKTIEAADMVIRTLIDTNASRVFERTPVFACSLALSALVYISAYLWVEELVDSHDDTVGDFSAMDMETYAEYIKLAINSITKFTEHFILSNKLVTHIRETIAKLIPTLHDQISVAEKVCETPTLSEISTAQSDSMKKSESVSSLDWKTSISDNSGVDNGEMGSFSPASETGCNWIDKMLVDDDMFNLEAILNNDVL